MIGRYRGRGHQLAEVGMCRTDSSTSATYLTAQLREAMPYLADAGWHHQTAKLLTEAATEIEHLQVDSRGQRDRGAWPHRLLAKPIFSPIRALIFGHSYCSAVEGRRSRRLRDCR
jgi:hypothetical protein